MYQYASADMHITYGDVLKECVLFAHVWKQFRHRKGAQLMSFDFWLIFLCPLQQGSWLRQNECAWSTKYERRCAYVFLSPLSQPLSVISLTDSVTFISLLVVLWPINLIGLSLCFLLASFFYSYNIRWASQLLLNRISHFFADAFILYFARNRCWR